MNVMITLYFFFAPMNDLGADGIQRTDKFRQEINSRNEILLGDCNLDGAVNLLDVAPFIDTLSNGFYITEADINQDGVVNLLDVEGFIDLLSG